MQRFVSPSLTQVASAAALLGALLLVPTRALAQDDVTLTMARERFKEGVSYFDKKDFAKARVAFLQAYALKKHPAVLLNLAQSELRSGHEADAAKHFALYLRDYKDATDAERQGAETGLTAAKALVAEVALDVDATGAEVYVDGDLEGQTPLPGPVFLAPGSHELLAKKEGKTAKSQVNASAGQSSSVSLKLAAAARPPAAGTVPAPSEGNTPSPPEEEPSHANRKAFFPWLASNPVAMVGAGVFGVGLIGGGAFALGSKSAYDAADSVEKGIEKQALDVDKKTTGATGVCINPSGWLAEQTEPLMVKDPNSGMITKVPRYEKDSTALANRAAQYQKNCDKYSNNVKSGDTFKTLAIVSLSVGAAAGVATIIYYFVDRDSDTTEASRKNKQRRIVFLPMHQPGYTGALLSGSF